MIIIYNDLNYVLQKKKRKEKTGKKHTKMSKITDFARKN